MSMEQARKFFETLQKDPKAVELWKEGEKPETEEELVQAYAKAAEGLGCETSAEELKAVYDEIVQAVAAKTEASEAGLEELAVEDLDSVAGGAFWGFNEKDHDECKDTYKHRENCVIIDACDKALIIYKGYWCAQASRIYCGTLSDEAP